MSELMDGWEVAEFVPNRGHYVPGKGAPTLTLEAFVASGNDVMVKEFGDYKKARQARSNLRYSVNRYGFDVKVMVRKTRVYLQRTDR